MSKTITIMQPYFMPYIGYWQLMSAVDEFVIYDNIQYTKKGWINKNRFLRNGKPVVFSLPLKKGSSLLEVKDRYLSDDFEKEATELLRQMEGAYKKAPNFEETFMLFEKCLTYDNKNLFDFIYNSILVIKEYLEIKTKIIISSSIDMDHSLSAADKVKAICHALDTKKYINPIGGLELYLKEDFEKYGIKLNFHKALPFEYNQFNNEFEPWLTILDVLMFNSKGQVTTWLKSYELI
tara:strand:- start:1680 stop:2387 length:708 start_codon:yes stop_codon:yes gene_type:complete